MKISTSLALLCIAGAASAQSKNVTPFKDINDANYYAPPAGVSFLVAGGSNDCANAATADAISGLGTFSVTTVGATNGVPDFTCNANVDVWFYWTSTVTGSVVVNTCGGSTADTILAVWADNATPGLCPTAGIVCNDDSCALQSSVTFAAVSGSKYFIQLGAFGAATTYAGTFTISLPPPPPVPPINDNCNAPISITGPGVYPFDNRLATTGTEGQTEPSCLSFGSTAIFKDAWWTYNPTVTGTVTFSTCSQVTPGTGDTRIAAYAGIGCPTAAAIGCNDDNAACTAQNLSSLLTVSVTCGVPITMQLGSFAAAVSLLGTFTVTETGSACSTPPVAYCFGDGTGTACPCGNAGAAGNGCASSVNPNGGNLSSSGVASISADTLILLGSGMASSSVLYFQGTSQISTVFGDGLRCAGGTVIRLGTKTNVAGASQYPELGDLSVSVRGSNVAGNVRNYQAWYRNAAAFCTASTFNLTNGLNLTWAP